MLRVVGILLCAGMLLAAGVTGNLVRAQSDGAAPETAPVREAGWLPPDEGGFGAFLGALESEQFTRLLFRRLSTEVTEGRVQAACHLFVPYFAHLQSQLPDPAAAQLPNYGVIRDDIKTALGAAQGSSSFDVPHKKIETLIGVAIRVARHIYGRAPGEPRVCVIWPGPEGEAPEAEAGRRAEATGLLFDAPRFVEQSHLAFLFAATGPGANETLLGELLQIAITDGLTVDRETVTAFVDRLIEAGKVGPRRRFDAVNNVWQSLQPSPPEDTDGEAAPEEHTGTGEEAGRAAAAGEGETAAPQVPESDNPPQDGSAETGPEIVIVTEEGRSDRADIERNEVVVPHAPADAAAQTEDRLPALVPSPGPVFFLEGGFGFAAPVERRDLDPVGQSVSGDPDIALRMAFGVLWPKALGEAHLSVSLVGVLNRTSNQRSSGGPSAKVAGHDTYFGVMPYVGAELPLDERVSVRVGVGLGVAWRDFELIDGGAQLAGGDGAALLAQLGAGVRVAITQCIDFGVDVYATYVGEVDGRRGPVAITVADAWDLAVLAGIRIALAGGGLPEISGAAENSCG